MNKSLHSISVHFAKTLSEAAQRGGLDSKLLLERSGLNEDLLNNPKIRITPDQLSELIREIWVTADDEVMGLTQYPCRLGVFLIMAKQAILCNNLGSVYRHIRQFYNLISKAFTLDLIVKDGEAHFTMLLTNPELDTDNNLREFLLLLWHRFPSWLIGRLLPLKYITVDFPEPKHSDEYKLMYPCPIKFNYPVCSLVFDASMLDSQLTQPPENLVPYLQTAPLQWFKRQAYFQVYTRRVINILEKLQPKTDISMERVANELHITSRTLRRKLLDEGTSFQELKDNVRRDQAIHYLSNPEIPISKIASLLGFTEPPAFTRAFKQWTGVSPVAYRQL